MHREHRLLRGAAYVGLAFSLSFQVGCSGSCKLRYEESDASSSVSMATNPGYVDRKEALKAYEDLRAACLHNDAKAMWSLMDDGSRQDSEHRARDLRELGSADLEKGLGYTGPLDGLDGQQVIALTMFGPGKFCRDARTWSIDLRDMVDQERFTIVSRPDGAAMGLFIRKDKEGELRARVTGWHGP